MDRSELTTRYQHFLQHGGVFDVTNRTRIRISGRDRLRVVNNLCTAKLVDLPVGGGTEAFFLDVKGHVVGHGVIFQTAAAVWIETAPGQGTALLAHFERYIVSEKVVLEDVSSSTAAWLVCGARHAELPAAVQTASADFPADGLACRAIAAPDQLDLVVRTALLGPVGTLWICPRSEVPNDRWGVGPWDPPELLEALRIAAGCPEFGRDIDSRNLPQEVGRDAQAISFTKGCYLGQETVARLDALGHVNRRLVRLEFAGETLPPVDFRIEQEGKAIGRVTSATYSPRTGRPLALAYVRSGFERAGMRLATELGDAEVIGPGA